MKMLISKQKAKFWNNLTLVLVHIVDMSHTAEDTIINMTNGLSWRVVPSLGESCAGESAAGASEGTGGEPGDLEGDGESLGGDFLGLGEFFGLEAGLGDGEGEVEFFEVVLSIPNGMIRVLICNSDILYGCEAMDLTKLAPKDSPFSAEPMATLPLLTSVTLRNPC